MGTRWSWYGRLSDERGFTIIELCIVATFITILATIAVALYANLQVRARIAQAQSDARTLGSSASMYISHMGAVPPTLTALTAPAVNAQGQTAGPFIGSVPTPPAGWAAYTYNSSTSGTFSISTSGDNTTVNIP
jgi:type II secretory pathway pseudopilin PulG